MRIVSFLPSGTEIVHALGAGAELVGRSHECDYPPKVTDLPVVSRPALNVDAASPAEVDSAIAARMASGESMYAIDEMLLRELEPDVILTQDLCRVCAPSGSELGRAVREFPVRPEILFLTPRNLAGIMENIRAVGSVIGRSRTADTLAASVAQRIEAVRAAVARERRRRVAFVEWTDPPFCAGHWVPEMVELAGGHDPLGRPGADSSRVTWEEIAAADPEIVIVSPCGYRLSEAVALARSLAPIHGARMYAVDANAYYARPGPRVADGVELLGHLFHPDRVAWRQADKPWAEIG